MNLLVPTLRRGFRWSPLFDELFDFGWKNMGNYDPKHQLRFDSFEDDSNLYLVADLPGVTQEDVTIMFTKGVLTIEASKTRSVEASKAKSTESYQGNLSRSLKINTPIDADKVEATLANGVLTVKLPKKEEAKPKTIEIKSK